MPKNFSGRREFYALFRTTPALFPGRAAFVERANEGHFFGRISHSFAYAAYAPFS